MDTRELIASRIEDCSTRRRAFQLWLRALVPLNVILVVLAGLLSLFAGAAVLTDLGVTSTQAGIMALTSAALTLIHTRLRCDPHQAECRRLVRQFDGLVARYEALQSETDETELQKRLTNLDTTRSALREGADAFPADWCTERAKKEARNGDV